MSYELNALAATAELLNVVAAEVPVARVVRLEQGLALIPMTDRLHAALHQPAAAGQPGFSYFPGGLVRRLEAWSQSAPIAYLEAAYFGGEGSQSAAVWVDGRLTLGPLHLAEDGPDPDDGTPISQALRRLGARRDPGRDEFETVGLGRRRDIEDWIAAAGG
ncbi:hypothetical protein AB0D08_13965 [Kitasatospora sp. NPDC048540]|uniref:hypothetical protein n=1 Tax=unclassified Kitasatospora TaxID=2633591 RepID=UPI00053AA7E2|nr:hypothetical protein [Kitasatospora sp. MBT63]